MLQPTVRFDMADTTLELPEERRQHLKLRVTREGKLITELSQRLGISGDTLRRDIQELAEAGLVQRERGALLLAPSTAPYPARPVTRLTAKQEVAARAARLIRPGQVSCSMAGPRFASTPISFQPTFSSRP